MLRRKPQAQRYRVTLEIDIPSGHYQAFRQDLEGFALTTIGETKTVYLAIEPLTEKQA